VWCNYLYFLYTYASVQNTKKKWGDCWF
jgi:hypothetical protein